MALDVKVSDRIKSLIPEISLNSARSDRLALSLQRFASPQKAVEHLCYLIQPIEDSSTRSTTLISFISLFSRLQLESLDKGLHQLLKLLGPTQSEQRRVFSQVVLGESLAVKFLRSILRISKPEWTHERLLEDLVLQKESLHIISLPQILLKEHFELFLKEFGEQCFHLFLSPSVTVVYSRPDRPALGINIYGEQPGIAYWKVRISEFRNDQGEVEWNLGVLSRNLRAGKIPYEKRKSYPPNAIYPGLGIRFSVLAFKYIRELAKRIGVYAIDVSPSHYHLVTFNRKLGADFDPRHSGYVKDLFVMDYLERELDKQGVGLDKDTGKKVPGGIIERSWYIQEGMIRDPNNETEHFIWHRPRMIYRIAST
jgi:hypothetical protein